MSDKAAGRTSGTEDSASESTPVASAAASPAPPPAEPSTAAGAPASSTDGGSDSLQKIKNLQETQRALKDQKKKCATEMKNAMKRKKRLQGKASQLSDTDLVEVLRMRKAKKETVQAPVLVPPQDDSPVDP